MTSQDALQPSAARADLGTSLVDPPDPELNRRFYRSVGSQWNWTDRLGWSLESWQRYLGREELLTIVGRRNGEEVGYFELEVQAGGKVEIVYFGLLPGFVGKGLGGALLTAAVEHAWALPGTQRVWVHTCTDDHERALANYRARGFKLFRTEQVPLPSDPESPSGPTA